MGSENSVKRKQKNREKMHAYVWPMVGVRMCCLWAKFSENNSDSLETDVRSFSINLRYIELILETAFTHRSWMRIFECFTDNPNVISKIRMRVFLWQRDSDFKRKKIACYWIICSILAHHNPKPSSLEKSDFERRRERKQQQQPKQQPVTTSVLVWFYSSFMRFRRLR